MSAYKPDADDRADWGFVPCPNCHGVEDDKTDPYYSICGRCGDEGYVHKSTLSTKEREAMRKAEQREDERADFYREEAELQRGYAQDRI